MLLVSILVSILVTSLNRVPAMPCKPALLRCLLTCTGLLLTGLHAFGQTASATPTATPLTTPLTIPSPTLTPASTGIAGPAWATLTKPQQTALLPLAKTWDSLNAGQQRKWLAIAKTYPQLAQPEQEKMHSRMVEWANLPAKDRELARLNFAQSKSVNKADRAAHWEAYQALSPEERQKLAEGAKVKPVGAAVAVKPVASDKLAAVPVTRHTPEPERATAASLHPLNRNTLLPQAAAKPAGGASYSGAGSAKP